MLAILLFVIVVLLVLVINLFLAGRRNRDDFAQEISAEEATPNKMESGKADILEEEQSESVRQNIRDEQEQIVYKDMKGTEAFRSSRETRHKSNTEDQIDILDLNDL